jgi:hypothetical protein
MARIMRKVIIGFGATAALLIIVGLIVTLKDSDPASAPTPNPNGYDDFVKAAGMIKPSGPARKLPSAEDLSKTVADNAEALQLARTGLTHQCRVPLDTMVSTDRNRTEALGGFQALEVAFVMEGKSSETENRPADAAQSYLAITRLGQEITRGGVVIDALVGSTIEGSGLSRLEQVALRLRAEQCREVSTALEDADLKRESVDNITHQEKVWARHKFGWRYYMHPIVIAQARHRASAITEQSDRTRKLMIRLAARAFELEHGAKPRSINDLVPNYLKTVPKDAFTGKDMTYPL